ncbi:MAG: rod shape-determining protein MreC [Actinomycetes bacterium]|jgi:rod shape-determining protein MreC
MAVYRGESRRRPVLILLVVTSLALITLSGTGNGGIIGSLRTTTRQLVEPVQRVVRSTLRPVTNAFDGVTKVSSLRDENARLRARVSQLEGTLSKQRAVGQEVGTLEQLLDLPNIEDATGVAARVVGGPPGNFERTITLDKGTAKGIVVGMPVVAGTEALVGRVTATTRDQATVTLIDSPGLGVGVRTEKTKEQAITQGRAGDRIMRLNFLGNPRAPIEVGELVFTAGTTGAAYPPDLAVGRVTKIDRNRGDLDPDIFVAPVVDLDSLVFVKALRWPPRVAGSG